jgi:hypothetical protein
MPELDPYTDALTPAVAPCFSYTRYFVVPQDDQWFIKFEGDEFGPYRTEREALLFAIDAAHKLGAQSQPTQVLVADRAGEPQPAWTFGQNPHQSR